jgi:hypothetical protein
MAKAQRYVDANPRDASAVVNRVITAMAREKSFAASILSAIQQQNRPTLVRLIAAKARVRPDQIVIDELDSDVLLKFTAKMDKTDVSGCVDTEDNRCGGRAWSVTVAGQ